MRSNIHKNGIPPLETAVNDAQANGVTAIASDWRSAFLAIVQKLAQ
ncbi:MAG: hypothetical protein ACFCA4_09140 [Cyanophyceae cyanobacterium]